MDGSGTLQKMQAVEGKSLNHKSQFLKRIFLDGFQTSSQAGNTDHWLEAWKIWIVTPGILMMGHSKLNISEVHFFLIFPEDLLFAIYIGKTLKKY